MSDERFDIFLLGAVFRRILTAPHPDLRLYENGFWLNAEDGVEVSDEEQAAILRCIEEQP